MAKISLIVNSNPVNANVDPRTLLVQFLRENLRLTGTHVGCDTSQCGACVVHLDGKAVKSCTTLAVMADGYEVKTIEGFAADGAPLHPMQEAFREHHGLQCGFCTPGMIMTAVDMVHRKGPRPLGLRHSRRARRQSVPLHRLSPLLRSIVGRRRVVFTGRIGLRRRQLELCDASSGRRDAER
jgi:carbon-monoxide dehydrogenase small subunit